MYNNSRITFVFEKSESDNTLLFTVVQDIFLLIDASLESGLPKRVAECWALRPMGELHCWCSTLCLATSLTMLLELFKHLTIYTQRNVALRELGWIRSIICVVCTDEGSYSMKERGLGTAIYKLWTLVFRMRVHLPRFASHWTASSTAELTLDKLPSHFIKQHESTMWDITRLGRGHRSQGPMSLSDAISFYMSHVNGPVQYGNDSAETTVVEEGKYKVVGLWGRPLSGSWPPAPSSASIQLSLQERLMSVGVFIFIWTLMAFLAAQPEETRLHWSTDSYWSVRRVGHYCDGRRSMTSKWKVTGQRLITAHTEIHLSLLCRYTRTHHCVVTG